MRPLLFFLLLHSFSLFLFLLSFSYVTMILELLGLKKPAFWRLFTEMTRNFVRLVFKIPNTPYRIYGKDDIYIYFYFNFFFFYFLDEVPNWVPPVCKSVLLSYCIFINISFLIYSGIKMVKHVLLLWNAARVGLTGLFPPLLLLSVRCPKMKRPTIKVHETFSLLVFVPASIVVEAAWPSG